MRQEMHNLGLKSCNFHSNIANKSVEKGQMAKNFCFLIPLISFRLGNKKRFTFNSIFPCYIVISTFPY